MYIKLVLWIQCPLLKQLKNNLKAFTEANPI